jgi:tetratricopeptide (TPR) repeat protein
LIEQSIESSPGVPTRYLFARGLLELAEGRLDAVRATSLQILEGALPPEHPDRTEDKATAYLEGLALMAEGRAADAIAELNRSLSLSGYEYAIYRLGLARALLASDRHMEAMAAARQAADQIDYFEPRLDLALDRQRARLVLAEVQAAMGRREPAAEIARALLVTWSRGDAGLPDLEKARELAGYQ